MVRASEKELLGAEDVAEVIGVKETTVWRWCREGTLPCLKVGKHWRIRREVLEDFLKRSERPATLVRRLESFLQVPDNVLAIAQNADILRRLDAAFFQVGEARGGLLVKFYGGEKDPEDELRAHLEQNGLEVGRLEREGRLLMRPEGDPLDGREEALGRILEEEAGKGRTVWASFNWALQVDLNTVLEQQERLSELVDTRQLVVKTAALEEAIDEWPAAALRRAQSSHSGTILASQSGLSLSRATPMPAS
ncbi:MAG TPA: helix-turn-helix domain-containing protein [Rubrobacter sp.]|nr:helix-turn-helix domain-containing protein [Rubrobacter sp.]